jgi:DNA-binding response OmpR family regulator
MADEPRNSVLIVEDEPDMNKLLAEVLSAYGFEPIRAATGEQALDLLTTRTPDAVILDLMLPGLSGYELCRRLKGARRTNPIPILILTALDRPEDRLHGYESGADDYLTKPFSPDGLVTRLQACLDRRRQAAAATGAIEMTLEPAEAPSTMKAVNALVSALYARTGLVPESVEAFRAGLARIVESAADWTNRHEGRPPLRATIHLNEHRLELAWGPAAEGGDAFLAEHLGAQSETVSAWMGAGAFDRRSESVGAVVFEKALPTQAGGV